MARRREATEDFFERKLVTVRRRLMLFDPPPQPLPAPQVHFASSSTEVRHLFCARYNACLDVAFAARWDGFSCHRCPAFRPPTMEENKSDMDAIANLLLAMHGLPSNNLEGQRWAMEEM